MTLALTARVEVDPKAVLKDTRVHDLAHALADHVRKARLALEGRAST